MHTVIYIRFKKGKDEEVFASCMQNVVRKSRQPKTNKPLAAFPLFFVYLFFCTLNQSSFAYISEPKHTNPGKK